MISIIYYRLFKATVRCFFMMGTRTNVPTRHWCVSLVPPKEARAPIMKGNETILLVDDEELIRDLVVQVLGESG